VAQSALSTQIRQLEAQLGQPLFTRQGRTLVLTEAGWLDVLLDDAPAEASSAVMGASEE